MQLEHICIKADSEYIFFGFPVLYVDAPEIVTFMDKLDLIFRNQFPQFIKFREENIFMTKMPNIVGGM